MTLQDIQPTSETWTRHTAGMQWFAAFRIDIHHGQHVAVLSRWTDSIADPRQTLLSPHPTRGEAVRAVEQLLAQLDYQRRRHAAVRRTLRAGRGRRKAEGERMMIVMVLQWNEDAQMNFWVQLRHRCRTRAGLVKMLKRGVKNQDWIGWRIMTVEEEGGVA